MTHRPDLSSLYQRTETISDGAFDEAVAVSATAQASRADASPFFFAIFPTAKPMGPAFGDPFSTTWEEFAVLCQRRRRGPKDGPGFVPATFMPEPDGRVRRLAANVLMRTAIVLDIETSKLTGQIPPSFAEAVGLVQAAGWVAVVYSSHSHTPAAPRYRMVLPLSEPIDPYLPSVEIVASQIGLLDVLDMSKVSASSLFYLPSAAPSDDTQHQTAVADGDPIDHDWITKRAAELLTTREAERARERAAALEAMGRRREATVRQGFFEDGSVIEKVRPHLDLVGELLDHGYTKVGDRFLYPKSESGVPGVYLLTGRDGVQRCYSHHSADPLAPGNLPADHAKALDAVDVINILDHGGDMKKTLRTLALRFGLSKLDKSPSHPDLDGQDPETAEVPTPDGSGAALRDLLSIASWAARDIPEPDRLLGDLLTTTARVFLVGRTGLGKTLLGLAIAAGIASGTGFLHWRSDRPARVLYLDGEMPAELIKPRARDAIRRLGVEIPAGNLLIFGRDIEKEARSICPNLPPFAPLNTEEGRQFLTSLINIIGGIDLIVLDNVMSLISGDQKDEIAWTDTLPLVTSLTDRESGNYGWITRATLATASMDPRPKAGASMAWV